MRREPASAVPRWPRASAERTTRAQQRDATRDRIVAAAAATFAERGFGAASTREIAARACVNQGLITFHFQSKLELWKAAADLIFQQLQRSVEDISGADHAGNPRSRARDTVRQYVPPRPIRERDLSIASIALANDLTVVTHNAAELSRVPQLRVEDWAASRVSLACV